MPVISANTQARREGYFRLEWKLADDGTHLMAKGTPFIIPVCVDDTKDSDALVPDSIMIVQWTHLPGGEASNSFCARMQTLLDGDVAPAAKRPPPQTAPLRPTPRSRYRRPWLAGLGTVLVIAVGLALWRPWRGPVANPPPAAAATSLPDRELEARQAHCPQATVCPFTAPIRRAWISPGRSRGRLARTRDHCNRVVRARSPRLVIRVLFTLRMTPRLTVARLLLSFVAFGPAARAASNRVVEVDLCVYGGTSGGVIAAVQAARLGKTALIVEPGRHLGGMTAGGLSWTDVGNSDRVGAIGGMARDVYERIGAYYGQKPGTAFDTPTKPEQVRLGVDYEKPPSLAFEPHVAEAVFGELVREAKVSVEFGERLANVRKSDRRVREVVTASGLVVRAKMFLDATYEGDLMAAAGISYTLGREANAQYGETANGIQGPATNPRAGKFAVAIDPYARPGDPETGVLPYLLRDEPLGAIGAADRRIQSYNFRVCLTDQPGNRLPLGPPAGYDANNYELLARWIGARLAAGEQLTLRSFLKYDPLQHGKFDFNNRWPISTDFIGGADDYPEANAARRAEIARAHEAYLRGFFHFLANDPRVPKAVRDEMRRFGLCRDEFSDNAGWPHQLYVREARRMVSAFVMTEHHARGTRAAPNSVGLGAYGVDLHAVRRIVVDGRPVNEGSNGVTVPRPYPIGYGAIVPKPAEAENVFVTFALSASHVAFGSIRMEPVFMTLSQSAATAAVIAITDNVPVQQVDYAKLRDRLRAAGVVLEWDAAKPVQPAGQGERKRKNR